MQKFIFIISLCFLAMFSLGGKAAMAQDMTEEQLTLQRIQDKLSSLEKSMATMQKEIYRSNKGSSKNNSPAGNEMIGEDAERSRALNGKFEEVEHEITTLAAKLDKIIADIDFRLAALEKKTSAAAAPEEKPAEETAAPGSPVDIAPPAAPVAPDVAPENTATPATTGKEEPKKPASAAAQYEAAFDYMRLNKYPEAEQAFKAFIANNKGHELLGNAYYWLGETYFARQNYQLAAVNFLKGYQDFPKGNKAADNLFKLAIALKNLKKDKEACATLDKMSKEYPKMDKDLAARASVERKGLKCK